LAAGKGDVSSPFNMDTILSPPPEVYPRTEGAIFLSSFPLAPPTKKFPCVKLVILDKDKAGICASAKVPLVILDAGRLGISATAGVQSPALAVSAVVPTIGADVSGLSSMSSQVT